MTVPMLDGLAWEDLATLLDLAPAELPGAPFVGITADFGTVFSLTHRPFSSERAVGWWGVTQPADSCVMETHTGARCSNWSVPDRAAPLPLCSNHWTAVMGYLARRPHGPDRQGD